MSKSTIAMAVLGLFLVAALALPVSAAPANGNAAGKAVKIDPQLKEDLWANHVQYRLQHYDLNVQRAQGVITILDKYGIDTTKPEATLATISAQRSALETALTNKDRDALKTINANLLSLWKQFAQEVKESIKSHYKVGRAGSMTGSGVTPDTGSDTDSTGNTAAF